MCGLRNGPDDEQVHKSRRWWCAAGSQSDRARAAGRAGSDAGRTRCTLPPWLLLPARPPDELTSKLGFKFQARSGVRVTAAKPRLARVASNCCLFRVPQPSADLFFAVMLEPWTK